jgi:divalent metal cation (Fe/Co/Zn/Cd) transporter
MNRLVRASCRQSTEQGIPRKSGDNGEVSGRCLGVHDLKAEYIGPDIVHAGFHIEVAKGTPIDEADRIAEEVKERVSREIGCQHCVIHVDPENDSPK